MPTLLIVGEHDAATPPDHVKLLFDAIPDPKELHIIKNAVHNFKSDEQIRALKKVIDEWLTKLFH